MANTVILSDKLKITLGTLQTSKSSNNYYSSLQAYLQPLDEENEYYDVRLMPELPPLYFYNGTTGALYGLRRIEFYIGTSSKISRAEFYKVNDPDVRLYWSSQMFTYKVDIEGNEDKNNLVGDFVLTTRDDVSAITLSYETTNNNKFVYLGSEKAWKFYRNGTTATVSVNLRTGAVLEAWLDDTGAIMPNSANAPTYSFTANRNIQLTALGNYQYNVELIYNSEFVTASYDRVFGDLNKLKVTSTLESGATFVGWFVNGSPKSSIQNTTITIDSNSVIECRAFIPYNVMASTDGNGAIDYARQQYEPNNVTITVIPNEHYYLDKFLVDGVEYTENPLQLELTKDVTVYATFKEYDKIFLNVSTNIPQASVYVSKYYDYSAFTSTLWARPFPDYMFARWDDGSTENPRDLYVEKDTTIVAIYEKVPDNNGIYQYRCFVKDQLHLTDRPKAFMTIDNFNLKVDKLTKSTSSFTVYDMPSNINDGDILVVYDPTGRFLYNGVINSIEERTIRTSNMESFYKGQWIYNTHSSTYLEEEIGWLLQQYAQGKIYQSTYTDGLVAQRLGGITIRTTGDNFSPSITAHLPSDLDKDGNEQMSQMDMETFIYELYEKYNIIFDFTINFMGENYVDIKVPNYTKLKIGNNMFGIQNMSPITTVEETNRLIIYSKDKTYRKTYVATKNSIVEEPATIANRFNITNTKIVFSDDDFADLIANNLPTMMYNHKLSFDLIIKNFVYQFGDFNLGGELDIYDGDDYYDSVLTGYEIQKLNNQNITNVHFVCGKIRTKLTQLLTLNKV